MPVRRCWIWAAPSALAGLCQGVPCLDLTLQLWLWFVAPGARPKNSKTASRKETEESWWGRGGWSEEVHEDRRGKVAGEQAERLLLPRPCVVLAVPGLDSTFSASLLSCELCCKARLTFHPGGWRILRARATASGSGSSRSRGASHRPKSSKNAWPIRYYFCSSLCSRDLETDHLQNPSCIKGTWTLQNLALVSKRNSRILST